MESRIQSESATLPRADSADAAARHDPFPTFFAALAGATLGFLLARVCAQLVRVPGSAPRADVVGWLSLPGNAAAKAYEIACFALAVVAVPVVARLCRRIAQRLGDRDPRCGAILAAGCLGVVFAGITPLLGSGGFAPHKDLAVGSAIFLATCVVAALRPWFRAVLDRTRSVAGERSELPYLGSAVVSLSIVFLVTGPRIPFEYGLVPSSIRLVGIAFACVALVFGVWLAATACTAFPAVAVAVPFRNLVALLAIRFAPEEPRFVALVVAVTVAGILRDCARLRRGVLDSGGAAAWRFVDRVALPLLVAVLVFHRDVTGALDPFHVGESVTPAHDAMHGALPYRDIYLQHGLGHNLLRTLVAFESFGATLEVERASWLFAIALTHSLFFVLARLIVGSRWLALALALFTSTPALVLDSRFAFAFAALAGVAVLVRDGERTSWAVAAGVFALGAALYSVDVGVYVTAAIALFLLTDGASSRRALWRFVGGFAAAAAVVAAIAFAGGVLDAMRRNVMQQVSLQLSVWALPFPSLAQVLNGGELLPTGERPPWLESPALLAIAAAGLYLLVLVVRFVRGFRTTATVEWRLLTLVALAGLFTFRSALGRADAGHLEFSATYVWLVAPALACLAHRALMTAPLAATLRWGFGLAPAGLLLGYALVAHVPLYSTARAFLRLCDPPTQPNRGNGLAIPPLPNLGEVALPVEQARLLASLHATVEEHLAADETFYDFSNMAALYFLTGRAAPTRYFMALYAATPDMQDEVIADLERVKPRLVVSSPSLGLTTVDGFTMEERVPRLASYLQQSYGEPHPTAFGHFALRRE